MNHSFTYKFMPRFADIDSYSIAHHSKYFCWFEMARFHFMGEYLDLPLSTVHEFRSPVIRLGCEFNQPVLFGQEYTIETIVSYKLPKASLTFNYEIKNDSGQLIAKGFTEHVFLNSNNELMLSFPDIILRKMLSLQEV